MKPVSLLAVAAVALIFAVTATAATSTSARDMTSAVRAVGYPKPHPVKLSCRGTTSYRCVAVYRHHRRRVFRTEWKGEGGWICAGPKLATCQILKHGWVKGPLDETGLAGAAELAAVGVMQNRYGIPQPFAANPCTKTGTSAWSCGYHGPAGVVTVTVSFKTVRSGYTFTATTA